MKPLHTFLAAAALLLAPLPLYAADEPAKPAPTKHTKKEHGPGLLNNLWDAMTFGHGAKKGAEPAANAAGVEAQVNARKVLLALRLEPQPLKLSETRQLKVTMRVSNESKKLVQLEFPTTQRIEVIVRNTVGKMVEQWSEDRNFENQPGIVSINPGEHLEYPVVVSTRDMAAGETYVVEALFPQYESLRVQGKVTPEK